MPYTNFPFGVTSFGVPLPSSGLSRANGRTHYFVNGQYGNDGNPGDSPNAPLLTMARAFALIESGDTIHLNGKINEQLVSPVGVFDVTIIGEGNRPRHADAHSSSSLAVQGGRSAATWAFPTVPVSGQAALRIQQQGWRLANILFAGGTTGNPASVELVRNAAAGDLERDASHASILGCRFAGGTVGIRFGVAGSFTEFVFNVQIQGNIFNGCTTAIGGIVAFQADIRDNVFEANTNHIVLQANECLIRGNMMSKFTTMSIDLASGVGLNKVYNNFLTGTFSVGGGYRVANANDDWGGNWNTGVGILTAADPA